MADTAVPRSDTTGPDQEPLAATRLYEPIDALSRQEEDIALAAELLHSGIVTEREIAAAVSSWSIHGSSALAEHLEQSGLLTATQLETLRKSAATRVERARRSVASGSQAGVIGKSMLLATLERIDGSGRVAKLLGVTVAARGGENDARVCDGRYELIRKLGQGGLGRVWLARDVNLNRHVALKEISHAGGMSDAVTERFRREAEITGRLEHPSIVPIYQLGEDRATGRVFYAMRFLGRVTLQDSINEYHERRQEGDDDPMLLRHLLTAFVNVCHAMGHAHSRKVIHRDLKPENVVIDSFGQVIVIDWGLAKMLDDAAVESLVDASTFGDGDRTSEGQILGTPLYMAPEQAAGRLDELDHRTDIYGLGAILFSIVTGQAPHEKTQKASIDSGLGARGMISTIASGSVPSVRELNPDAPPALEAICRRAMARRRYARYQQAAELAEDVQRWMAGEPVAAYQETSRQRVNRWISQHRGVSQGLLAAAMVALVALTILGVTARHNHVAASRARFAMMEDDVGEVEARIRGVAGELAKDVRFLASLPAIKGVMDARSGAAPGESEEVKRLETIFAGMLQSNSQYLALSLEAKQGEGAADVVRVERSRADASLIRALPKSRLHRSETDQLAAAIAGGEPGDVRLSLEARSRFAERSGADRLSAATPVYDDLTGELFGMTVIESDVSQQVVDVLLGLGTLEYQIYLADGRGLLWALAEPERGVRIARAGQLIPNLPADVAEELKQTGQPFDVTSPGEYIAKRFYIDPTGRGILIFARIQD